MTCPLLRTYRSDRFRSLCSVDLMMKDMLVARKLASLLRYGFRHHTANRNLRA